MVRTKQEIKPIEDKAKRHTTFTKRRQGLIKKAQTFAAKFDAQAAVVAFSKAGNVFAFGDPSVEGVVDRYLAAAEEDVEVEEGGRRAAAGLAGEEALRVIGEALRAGSWGAAIEGLDEAGIDCVAGEIARIKRAVAARAAEVAALEGEGKDGSPEGGSGGSTAVESPVGGVFGGKL
ncbi:AGAMOUS-like 71 [Striga hermonthica]|uniref:AGAMOUS-like 71 n=1 Tax=Striga hermonthica TaxID=68872 RepID=A0A9N7NWU8_STRHE|nr:AGAMOUS-like 71 [Striga hermonthica]